MAEPRQITFSYQELAELLVRQQDIHEGLWGVYVELGIGGANISVTEGADAVPAAIVPLQRMGIQKLDAEVPGLTVDAAKVNPANGVGLAGARTPMKPSPPASLSASVRTRPARGR